MTPAGEAALLYKRRGRAAMPRNLAFRPANPQKVARRSLPLGDTMDTALARQAMVDRQVRPHDVTDLRILSALLDVPRERFLDPAHAQIAYLDTEVPVSAQSRRTLLKPIVFGKLLQAAGIREGERVLDVGCATGYSASAPPRSGSKYGSRWSRQCQ